MAEAKVARDKDSFVQPTEKDILSGRRGKRATYTHPGNERYHAVVSLYLDRYAGETSKVGKTSIVRAIINLLVKKEGRRFLQKRKTSDAWQVMSRKATLDKVGHSLRDLKQQRVAEGVAKRLEAKKSTGGRQALQQGGKHSERTLSKVTASALIQAPQRVPTKFMGTAVPAPAIMSSAQSSLLQELVAVSSSSIQRQQAASLLQQHQSLLAATRSKLSQATTTRNTFQAQSLLRVPEARHLVAQQAASGEVNNQQRALAEAADLQILCGHRLLEDHRRRFVAQRAVASASSMVAASQMERTLGLAQQILDSNTTASTRGKNSLALLQQQEQQQQWAEDQQRLELQQLLDRHRNLGS